MRDKITKKVLKRHNADGRTVKLSVVVKHQVYPKDPTWLQVDCYHGRKKVGRTMFFPVEDHVRAHAYFESIVGKTS